MTNLKKKKYCGWKEMTAEMNYAYLNERSMLCRSEEASEMMQ